MTNAQTLTGLITNVADGVRSVTGATGPLTLAQMDQALDNYTPPAGNDHFGEFLAGTLSGTYEYSDITKINAYAMYYYNPSGVSLHLSFPNVTTVGGYAFQFATALKSISLPCATASVQVGSNAFDGSGLTSAVIGDTAQVGTESFKNCTSLTSVQGGITFGTSAFSGCSNLTTVNSSSNWGMMQGNIGTRAFQNCSKLKNVSFPGIRSVGQYAFSYCTALTHISLPLAKTFGQYAFQFCSYLQSAELKSITSFGNYMFSNCSALQWISFDDITALPTTTAAALPIPSGTTLYLPTDLVATAQADSKWSSYTIKDLSEKPSV